MEQNDQIQYKKTPVANGTLMKVIKAGMTSHIESEQTWNYYVTKGKPELKELAQSGENASAVCDAPAVIVPVYSTKGDAPTAEDVEKSRAIGNMLVIMEEMELAGEWVNAMEDEAQQEAISAALHISSEYVPMGILTLGYPEKTPEETKKAKKKKKDTSFRKRIHFVDSLGRY
ncbi:MAG: nitroreductase family protein [Eubacteriales bacterium]|nr:nitroreductase family protein [Eubacteriales bacterium]